MLPEIGIQRRFGPYTVRPAITDKAGNGYIYLGPTEAPQTVLHPCDYSFYDLSSLHNARPAS